MRIKTPFRLVARGSFLMLSFLFCSGAPFRPANLQDFLQGQWIRTGTNCDGEGDCAAKGSALFMQIEENRILWKKSPEATTATQSIYRENIDDRVNITEVESARTYMAKIIYISSSEFLISSREWPAKFEKWQRQK